MVPTIDLVHFDIHMQVQELELGELEIELEMELAYKQALLDHILALSLELEALVAKERLVQAWKAKHILEPEHQLVFELEDMLMVEKEFLFKEQRDLKIVEAFKNWLELVQALVVEEQLEQMLEELEEEYSLDSVVQLD